MARSPAMDKAIRKYDAEKVEKILIRVPKGEKEKLRLHAEGHGESLNAFVCRAIRETKARDEINS